MRKSVCSSPSPATWDDSFGYRGSHCLQIIGIVWAVSWRRDIRNGTFYYYPVGTENVSFPKPVSFALCPVDLSHRLSKLIFAIHPPAQFLSSVLLNNSDLIFITMIVVRHVFSP
jgi:hypothetical protein